MSSVTIRLLGRQPYLTTWQAMQQFTRQRDEQIQDEIWLLEHPPVYTQGQAGKPEHLLNPGNIPVIQTDRGGQITYHGPGQLVAYPLIDLRRQHFKVRDLVSAIERSIIDLLNAHGITGRTRCNAPGVYVDKAKICSLGLRVKRACSYHGLALNVAMDLAPFNGINPCGFERLSMTQIRDFVPDITLEAINHQILPHLCHHLGYTVRQFAYKLPSLTEDIV